MSFTSGVNADLGEELTPTQVKDQPSVSWDNQPNLFYTLSFIGKREKNENIIIRVYIFTRNSDFIIIIIYRDYLLLRRRFSESC